MSEFIQLHILTSYPPANLNRDDLGRPKTALFGGSQRQRTSSQSLKRSWRTSDAFRTDELASNMGLRTREMGGLIYDSLTGRGVDDARASAFAKRVAAVFGKLPDKPADEAAARQLRQLAHISAAERRAIERLTDRVVSGDEIPDSDLQDLLTDGRGSVDIALFGRMLADSPSHNVDAAVQVAHAITVHKVAIEDDYFTAVDDLNRKEEHSGAGHVNVAEFSAGLFYSYCCINRTLLVENLSGDDELASHAIRALTEAAATTGPKGKVNSYGSYAYASYVLAERGDRQPRNLSVAFIDDVRVTSGVGGAGFLTNAINALETTRARFDRAYGPAARETCILDVSNERGSLPELLTFVEKKV